MAETGSCLDRRPCRRHDVRREIPSAIAVFEYDSLEDREADIARILRLREEEGGTGEGILLNWIFMPPGSVRC